MTNPLCPRCRHPLVIADNNRMTLYMCENQSCSLYINSLNKPISLGLEILLAAVDDDGPGSVSEGA